jgi:hypothetical protein
LTVGVFADKAGREWRVEIDLGVALDLKDELGLDLGDPKAAGERLAALADAGPFAVFDILWVVLREQAQKAGVDRKALLKAVSPEALAKATDLLMGAVLFFTRPRLRATLEARMPAILGAIDARLAAEAGAAVDAGIARLTSPNSGTDSAASPGATPAG